MPFWGKVALAPLLSHLNISRLILVTSPRSAAPGRLSCVRQMGREQTHASSASSVPGSDISPNSRAAAQLVRGSFTRTKWSISAPRTWFQCWFKPHMVGGKKIVSRLPACTPQKVQAWVQTSSDPKAELRCKVVPPPWSDDLLLWQLNGENRGAPLKCCKLQTI